MGFVPLMQFSIHVNRFNQKQDTWRYFGTV